MQFANGQQVWIGSRMGDLFPAVASQNCQTEVIAGKAVASFARSATGSCHPNARSGQAFMAHHTLKVQQGLHVKAARINVNKS